MAISYDTAIVIAYFLLIFAAGHFVSRRYRSASAAEFISGGRTLPWYKTALTIAAMAVDPGIMGLAGLGFLWGFYPLQWNAVHIWATGWFAAMFLVPVYWRSRIVTTPELLEKRFSTASRVFFSTVMMAILVTTLAFGLYFGAILLRNFLGWSFWVSVIFVALVAVFYVVKGGMRTVLAIDVYQALFLLATIFAVTAMVLVKVGGPAGLASIKILGEAGTRLSSTVPPNDWNLASSTFFPLPAVLTWASVAGLSWLACNFGMVQRLLAARSEKDAQKSLLFTAFIVTLLVSLPGYIIGVGARTLMPGLRPDEAFARIILDYFPAGLKGILVAGLMAALLSTIDGMFTASSALFTEDIYRRFIRPKASAEDLKRVARLSAGAILLITLTIVPFVLKSETGHGFLQSFYGVVLGVVLAIYLVGIFSRRAAPRAAFLGMISGIVLAIGLDVWTPLNFAYVGFFSFLYTIAAVLLISRLEKAPSAAKLADLTVFTLSDVKGPWVGLKAWPRLMRWAGGLAFLWFVLTVVWELYIRTR
jgi:solute:Na+ symporter, SSS family